MTFNGCVDGDTAHFIVTEPDGTKKDERVRLFVVDTKESTIEKMGMG